MNANENTRSQVQDDGIVEFGVASVETKGDAGFGEMTGIGDPVRPGISEA